MPPMNERSPATSAISRPPAVPQETSGCLNMESPAGPIQFILMRPDAYRAMMPFSKSPEPSASDIQDSPFATAF